MSARVAPQGSLIQTHRGHARVLPAAVSGGAGASAYAAAVLADTPVSYWRLNETSGTAATDSAGTNTGTYNGGFTLNQAGPVTGGKSVLFNGTTGYVSVPSAANLAITGDLTIEAWVNPTDRTNFWFIVTKDSASQVKPYEYRLEQTSGLPSFAGLVNGTAAPATAAWSHVAMTYSGSTITHYLNGATNGSGLRARSDLDAGTPLRIGTRDDLFSFFKGSMAEVAIYNTALSPTRIAAHYAAR